MMRRGDILLFSGRAPGSLLIRWATRSAWSHAAWVTAPGQVLESTSRGVDVRSASRYRGRCAVVRPRWDYARVLVALERAEGQVGREYDWIGLGSLALIVLLGRQDGARVRQACDRWWCSELIARPLADEGLEVRPDPRSVVPADLWPHPAMELVGRW